MSTPDPILEAAELREEPLALTVQGSDGQKHVVELIIREPSAIESIEYRDRRRTDHTEAMAYLMALCVLNADTRSMRWTLEQARKVAGGREEVWTPIVLTLTGFGKREKKASPAPSDSTTALQ